jgi:hypothetical protein
MAAASLARRRGRLAGLAGADRLAPPPGHPKLDKYPSYY